MNELKIDIWNFVTIKPIKDVNGWICRISFSKCAIPAKLQLQLQEIFAKKTFYFVENSGLLKLYYILTISCWLWPKANFFHSAHFARNLSNFFPRNLSIFFTCFLCNISSIFFEKFGIFFAEFAHFMREICAHVEYCIKLSFSVIKTKYWAHWKKNSREFRNCISNKILISNELLLDPFPPVKIPLLTPCKLKSI